MKAKKKSPHRTRKKTIAEQEASLFSNAKISKEAYNRGFDLGKTGIIRSLLNFIATSTWKPIDKKGVKGRYLKFDATGKKWIENLHQECNQPDNSEYYEGWNKDRDFACETDILENNHPDYQVLGGKIGVHSTIKKQLIKEAKEPLLENIMDSYNKEQNEYWDYIDSQVGNIEIEELIEYYNKDYLNYWKNYFVKLIKDSEENIIYHKELLKNKLSKKEKENSLNMINDRLDYIKKVKSIIPYIYYLKDKIFYNYEKLNTIIINNKFKNNKNELRRLNNLNYLRKNIDSKNKDDYIKLIQYDYEIHNILNKEIF